MTEVVLADISGITEGVVGAAVGIIGLFFAWRADSELKKSRQEQAKTLAELKETRSELASASTAITNMQSSFNGLVVRLAEFLEGKWTTLSPPALTTESGGAEETNFAQRGLGQTLKLLGHRRSTREPDGSAATIVGALDVTNDGRQSLLMQSHDHAQGKTVLSILGIRQNQPSELAAVLSNNSGANFIVRDIDGDQRVEIITVEASAETEGMLAPKAWRWNGAGFELITNLDQAAIEAARDELSAPEPRWADSV